RLSRRRSPEGRVYSVADRERRRIPAVAFSLIDPHKVANAAVVLDERGQVLAERRFPTNRAGLKTGRAVGIPLCLAVPGDRGCSGTRSAARPTVGGPR